MGVIEGDRNPNIFPGVSARTREVLAMNQGVSRKIKNGFPKFSGITAKSFKERPQTSAKGTHSESPGLATLGF